MFHKTIFREIGNPEASRFLDNYEVIENNLLSGLYLESDQSG